jgi:hypothetical protein
MNWHLRLYLVQEDAKIGQILGGHGRVGLFGADGRAVGCYSLAVVPSCDGKRTDDPSSNEEYDGAPDAAPATNHAIQYPPDRHWEGG